MLESIATPNAHSSVATRTRTIVVLPTYNERENIERVLGSIQAAAQIDALIVDDGSPDGTGELCDELALANPAIHVLHRQGKGGLASAYVAGFRWAIDAGYDTIIQMDADGQHPSDKLPRMLDALQQADLVIGSRWVAGGDAEGWAWHRRLVSQGGSRYARLLLGLPVSDLTGGFKAWRADLLRRVLDPLPRANGYVFQVEMTYRAHQLGGRIVEIPIHFGERAAGESKFSKAILAEAMWQVLAMRVHRELGRLR